MLKFANRVAKDELKRFINKCGFDVHDLTFKCATDNTYVHGVFNISSYRFNFIFDDFSFQLLGIEIDSKLIKRFEKSDADITSWDWKCFLRAMFGEEYVTLWRIFYKRSDFLTSEFVDDLSMEDIRTLISKDEVIVGSVQEVEAFEKGTRRFKFFSQNAIREAIVAAYYPSCSIERCIDETSFVKFMYEKFGNAFRDYYRKCLDVDLEVARDNAEAKLMLSADEKLSPEYYEMEERVYQIREILRN